MSQGRAHLPPLTAGLRVGLFGGSFNPPHEGHLLVARTALRRLGLDRLWWIVTPGNPLKENSDLPPQAERMAACEALIDDPRMVVTGFEGAIGTRYTSDTVRYLASHSGGARFVWIMGADSLAGFHRWQNWRTIAATLPIAVIDRPGATLKAASAKTARFFAGARIDDSDAHLIAEKPAPAWVFLYGPRSTLSSTELRQRGKSIKTSQNRD